MTRWCLGREGEPVEAGGVVDQRVVAAGANVGDDGGDGGVDAGGGVATVGDEGAEGGGEAGVGGGETLHRASTRLAEAGDQGADGFRPGLERGSVDDEAAGDLRDHFGLLQAVGLQRAAGLDQVDDQAGEAQARRQLHRAVEVDDFGLDPAGGVMLAGDVGVFGGDADARPGGGVVEPGGLDRLGHADPAAADAEVERGVDLGVVELHQHVRAADADMGGAEGDEGGDVERADADDVERRVVGREAEAAAVLVEQVGRGHDAGPVQQRAALTEDAALGQSEDQRRVDLRRQCSGREGGSHTMSRLRIGAGTSIVWAMAGSDTRSHLP